MNNKCKWVLLFGAGIFLVSCGQKPAEPDKPVGDARGGTDQKVTFYVWADYADPAVFELFTERTGIEVEVIEIESTEDMLAEMRYDSSRYDVLIADDITVSLLRELSLIRELDPRKLPHLGNVDPKFRDLPFDRGNAHSVPYMWGATLVAYRKDKIPEPDQSWSILWDPKYQGKVMMIDEVQDIFGVTLLAAGRSADAEDPESIDFAKGRVMDQIRAVDVEFAPYTEVLEKLQSGEAWVGMNYSGDVAMVIEEHPEIDFFIPREGALLWLDNFVISRDSKNVEAAHKFIDFMIEAEVAAANSNFVWYASPNLAAEEYLEEDLKSDERLYPPPHVMAKCQFPTPEIQANREHLLNIAMRDIRKLRREMDEEGGARGDLSAVGEALE